jgi:hypothetical protein
MAAPTESPRTKPTRSVSGVLLVGMSVAAWWPAFTLGAWGTLFFDQELTVWAAATAAFFVVLFQPRPSRHRIGKALALLVPSLWLVLGFIDDSSTQDLLTILVSLLAILVSIVGIPFTIWVLARIMWPEFGKDVSRRNLWLTIVVVVGITAISFGLGANQSRFLHCEDFTISGNSEPPGCVPASPAPTAAS